MFICIAIPTTDIRLLKLHSPAMTALVDATAGMILLTTPENQYIKKECKRQRALP